MLDASKLKLRSLDNYIGMYNNHLYKIGGMSVAGITNQIIFNDIIRHILDNSDHRHAVLVLSKIKQAFNFASITHLLLTTCL